MTQYPYPGWILIFGRMLRREVLDGQGAERLAPAWLITNGVKMPVVDT